ncbi:hypothetical protein [Flavobacterium muglaense]|uniref:hypothetical protein n=1 Tax=Flavobacterium muglaense TaxID=2764716 RepID=UPI00164ED220|nr:hypothetical protein [Flavobacterium muglaense]MBC5837571.1 hypothetical protein [Flavobacterium muglaense]
MQEVGPLKYYSDNAFISLLDSDKQKKEYTGINPDVKLETRLMFYDLILLKV